ncbi:MAG: potassium/proton antiporter [Gammaproteobacteria bacterium]|nr:potassium/proton antiporter [Gammaproteobacteria bacterium]
MPAYTPEIAILVIGLLLVTTVLAGSLSSRFGLPALIGFLALGMFAGSDGPVGIRFDNYPLAQTIGVVCLIFILFSGGLDTKWQAVKGVVAPALVLATAGVVMSAAILSVAAVLLLDFTPLQGFLLGSVVASTDAAAVFAIIRSQSTPLDAEIAGLIELESGSNDPMAIFLVGAAVIAMSQSGSPPWMLAPLFAADMLIGGAVGVAVGLGLPAVLRRARLRVGGLALVISVAAALLAYGVAGVAGGNGFLGAYIAGIVAGSREFVAKRDVLMFQDGVAWLAQVVMFVALGLLVFPSELPAIAIPGLAVTAILMFVARPVSVVLCLLPFRRFDWRVLVLVSWAGLRGAVPIVLATFPIVAGIPGAQTIFNIVFFVVVVSNVVQGTTLGPLARRLGLTEPGK